MSIIEAIILGIVQGLTEFIPVSSSGHLVLLRGMFDIYGDYLLFDLTLHAATLLAVSAALYKHIIALFKPPFKTAALLVVASIPAVISGFLLEPYVSSLSETPKYLCFFFFLTAVLLLVTQRLLRSLPTEGGEIKLKTALLMGTAQAIAVFPAVSRSGSTIAGGALGENSRSQIAVFSFLMSIPIIAGGALLQLGDTAALESMDMASTLAGFVAAFVSGFVAVKLMLRLISRANFAYFSLYLFLLGGFSFFRFFI